MTDSALAQIVSNVIDLVGSPFTSDNVVIGRRESESVADQPRVVFIPIGGPIVPPDRVGHGNTVDGVRARIIAVRNLTVLVECHGPDDGGAEAIMGAFVLAVRNVVHASGPFSMTETWPDQVAGEDSFDKDGALVTFTFTVQLPIYDVPHDLTTLLRFAEESETFAGEEVPCDE